MLGQMVLSILFAFLGAIDEHATAPDPMQLLQHFANGRSLLMSGEVITQTLRVESVHDPERVHQELTTERVIRFDVSSSSFRTDTSEQWDYIEGPGFEQLVPRRTGAIHILTPEYSVTKSLGTESIHITKPAIAPIFLQDLRIVGLVLSQEALQIYSLEAGVEYLNTVLEREGNRTEVRADGRLYVLVTDVTPVGPPTPMFMRRRAWFDPEIGWVPTRLLKERIENVDGRERLLCVQNELTVSWVNMSGVYVPASLLETTFVINGADNSTAGTHEVSTTFSWKRVNEDLSPEDFEASSLDEPKGSHTIWDSRSGQMIMVQHPLVADADMLRTFIAETQVTAPVRSSRFSGAAIGGLVVAILASLCFVLSRRARRADS